MTDNQQDPLVMYLIINSDLNLSIGKVGVSTAHAATTLALNTQLPTIPDHNVKTFHEWYDGGAQRKVVLRCETKEWKKIKELLKPDFETGTAVLIRDAGFVEVEKGAETCLGLWPQYKSQAPKLIKRLQTLK